MIRLQSQSETGLKCPKCGNESVFTYKVFGGLLKMIYRYTLYRCEMDNCDHEVIRDDKNKIRFLYTFNVEDIKQGKLSL